MRQLMWMVGVMLVLIQGRAVALKHQGPAGRGSGMCQRVAMPLVRGRTMKDSPSGLPLLPPLGCDCVPMLYRLLCRVAFGQGGQVCHLRLWYVLVLHLGRLGPLAHSRLHVVIVGIALLITHLCPGAATTLRTRL